MSEVVSEIASLAADVIHLVWGSTGEYSDRYEYPVCAFWSEAEAQAEAERLGAAWREIVAQFPGRERWEIREEMTARIKALDPCADAYDEPSYTACAVPLAKAPSPESKPKDGASQITEHTNTGAK